MNDKNKIEVRYQSNLSIVLNRIKSFILKILKPVFAIIIILSGLYVAGYIIFIFIIFFALLYLYNKIKNSI